MLGGVREGKGGNTRSIKGARNETYLEGSNKKREQLEEERKDDERMKTKGGGLCPTKRVERRRRAST